MKAEEEAKRKAEEEAKLSVAFWNSQRVGFYAFSSAFLRRWGEAGEQHAKRMEEDTAKRRAAAEVQAAEEASASEKAKEEARSTQAQAQRLVISQPRSVEASFEAYSVVEIVLHPLPIE